MIDCCEATLVALLLDISSSSRNALPDKDVFNTGDVSVGAVNVLFVRVCVPDKVTTVASIAKVTLFPLAVLLIPTPPSNPKVSLSKSIAMVVLPSEISKSCNVTCASTYAFILCCVDNAVAEFESMPSSSSIVVTVAPLSPNCKLNSFCVSCLPSVVSFAVHLTLALS